MTLVPAGSVPWLLLHEMRLMVRGRTRGSTLATAIAIGAITLLMLGAGIPAAYALRDVPIGPRPFLVLILDLVVAVLFTLLLSQTLAQATLALYERGDLDLLLSSPLPPRRVLIVRFLGIATMPFLIFASLVTPFIVPMAFFNHAEWLASYGVLGALALAATAMGLIVAMGLFSLIGPRRTKVVGQVLAAIVGALFFLGAQARNLFPNQTPWVYRVMKNFADKDLFHASGLATWPARAIMGDPLPLAIVMGGAIIFFFGTASILGARFSANAAVAAGMDERIKTRTRITAAIAFRTGARNVLLWKEFRLLYRDPALLSQVLLRLLYVFPLLFLLLRNAAAEATGSVGSGAAGLVFFASQIAASLAWIAISAEDSPELLASAPLAPSRLRRVKIEASLIPVGAVFAVPVLALAWYSPFAALVTAVNMTGASLSTALINLWYEKPGQRKNFRRRSNSSLLSMLAEFLLGLSWSAATISAIARSPWSVLAFAVSIVLLGLFYLARPRIAGQTI